MFENSILSLSLFELLFAPNEEGKLTLFEVYWGLYNEYRQFTPNPEGGARSNAMMFDNRQQKNSESHELRT